MNDLQVLWQKTEMSMYKKKKKRSHFKSNIKYILQTYFFSPGFCMHITKEENEHSHLLLARLVHQILPNWAEDLISVCCHTNVKCVCVGRHSQSVLWHQQHLCLLWYPAREQTLFSIATITQSRFCSTCNRFSAALTFSPARPRSPVTPGSVTPGRPCKIHSGELRQPHSANLITRHRINA